MTLRLSEYGVFIREFWRDFHATGAILPSGRRLAGALARFVGQGPSPKRILEVGPGTGAVTRRIVAAMGPDDRLDLVELNAAFADRLRAQFASDPALAAAGPRTRVLQTAIELLPRQEKYDVIVSGLPLNNFSVATVEAILGAFRDLLSPGGTLSFFEYIAIRRFRRLVSGWGQRERLSGIGRALDQMLGPHEILREAIWLNVPPAWAHHVRFRES